MDKALKIAQSISEGRLPRDIRAFDSKKDINDFLNLQAALLNSLPNFLRAGNEKNVGSFYEESYKALQYSFISYGTKKAVQILMFDDDSKKCATLEEYLASIREQLGFNPTFITETPNGYQFGIILKQPVFTYHKNSHIHTNEYLTLKDIKETITKKIGCDVYGSHRLIGVWRNPLQHNFIYTAKQYYLTTLKDLLSIKENTLKKTQQKREAINSLSIQKSNIPKMRLGDNTKISKTIKDGFYKGNRNNYLFAVGFKIVFEDRKRVVDIEEELLQINASQENPLTTYEVKNIAKSVIAYSNKMYISIDNKKRGRLSDEMWKKNIHGIQKRRAYAGHSIAKERAAKSIEKVLSTLVELFDKGEIKPKNHNIAKEAKLSVRQIQRYKKIINISNVLLQWIKGLASIKIVIRAYVTLIKKRVFLSCNTSSESLHIRQTPTYISSG
jgi:hypothetical protein